MSQLRHKLRLRGTRDRLHCSPARPPGRGAHRYCALTHTSGVTTFDREPALASAHNSAPISDCAADARAHHLGQSSHDLLAVTAQLVEAACRARNGDSDGARAHIARAVALLDQHPQSRIAGNICHRDRAQIPRGGFAAWQSRRLAAHVDANLAGKIVVKDLAASLHVSVGHFCRAFKRTFGMPARFWIRRRRIELAQGLMLTTGASLTDIALTCGMSDQSHFTRSFRRIVGETPSSWRQTRQGVIDGA
jgi:AraC family transcriptional regulator